MRRILFAIAIRVALVVLVAATATPSFAGGVAILETVLTDNGDNDGFADTNETVNIRLRVQNTSGVALTGVSATLHGDRPALACLTTSTIQIGDLAVGEIRLTTEAFVLKVAAGTDRTALGKSAYDDLSEVFAVAIDSQPDQPAHPPKIALDLDLDVSGGSGPTTFFESFENGMGAFEVQNLDQGLTGAPHSNGYRCQYNDPDGPNANVPGYDCQLGSVAGHSEAVFWGLSGPETSPGGGRGFSGFHSLFYGIDLGPPENWTTPVSVLEAARTAQPIRLGHTGTPPVLTFKHQVSLADHRDFALPPGLTYDNGVVMAQVANDQGNPVGPWFKIYPFQNPYDQKNSPGVIQCTMDPTDDGSTEDDFFDPTDPNRRYGPSSLCYPEPVFADIGETSNAFNASNKGRADGPGLAGLWGIGTWIESKFDLGRFRGRQIRVRFLAEGIDGPGGTSWEDVFGSGFNPVAGDDGWWIDDVTVTNALTTAATVVVDVQNNTGLPGGLADADADGIFDTCDNCAAQANNNQYDRDFDRIGNVCDICPDDATNLDADSDTVCNSTDNCPAVANTNQLDSDADNYGNVCDCAPTHAATHPGAVEVNDGLDNQCPGDAGYGAIDEIGNAGFGGTPTIFVWAAQPGATKYQVVRGTARDFSTGCTLFLVTGATTLTDPSLPSAGNVFYYLVRAFAPNTGSWGLRSNGVQRDIPCD